MARFFHSGWTRDFEPTRGSVRHIVRRAVRSRDQQSAIGRRVHSEARTLRRGRSDPVDRPALIAAITERLTAELTRATPANRAAADTRRM